MHPTAQQTKIRNPKLEKQPWLRLQTQRAYNAAKAPSQPEQAHYVSLTQL